jgi:hypothetical protein
MGLTTFNIRLLSICRLSALPRLLILCLLFLLLVGSSLVLALVTSKKIKVLNVLLLLFIAVLSPEPAPDRVQERAHPKKRSNDLRSISKPVLVLRRMPIQVKIYLIRYYSLLADLFPLWAL